MGTDKGYFLQFWRGQWESQKQLSSQFLFPQIAPFPRNLSENIRFTKILRKWEDSPELKWLHWRSSCSNLAEIEKPARTQSIKPIDGRLSKLAPWRVACVQFRVLWNNITKQACKIPFMEEEGVIRNSSEKNKHASLLRGITNYLSQIFSGFSSFCLININFHLVKCQAPSNINSM